MSDNASLIINYYTDLLDQLKNEVKELARQNMALEDRIIELELENQSLHKQFDEAC